jgi:hypothetical protein
MLMKKKMLIVPFVLVVLSCMLVSGVFAQSRLPGVAANDVFSYTEKSYWTSSDPTAIIPQNLLEVNNTVWYRVTVTQVASSNVSIFSTWFFTNNTSNGSSGIVDVASGLTYGTDFYEIIGSNLNVGDLVHPTGTDMLTINATVPRIYQNVERDANLITWTIPPTSGNSQTETINLFADKATGMLVELNDTVSISSQTSYSIIWTLYSSNVWVLPEFSTLAALPILFFLTLMGALFYKIRLTRNTKSL